MNFTGLIVLSSTRCPSTRQRRSYFSIGPSRTGIFQEKPIHLVRRAINQGRRQFERSDFVRHSTFVIRH
jgi:hypothetical protein